MSEFRRRLMMQQGSDPDALPVGCVRCEYLESTGIQGIDTEYYPQIGDEILINNVQFYGSEQRALFSSGIGDYQLILLTQGSTGYYYKYFSTGAAAVVRVDNHNIHNIKINRFGQIYINDELITGNNPVSETDTQLFLLKRANNSSYFNGTIGEFVVSKNGKDVLHLLPILDAKGTPCMYDIVSKKFYYNKGTGVFGYKIMNNIGLPNGYKKVSYISKSTSNPDAFIDTNVVATINTKLYAVSRDEGVEGGINWQGAVDSGNHGWFCWGSYGADGILSVCSATNRNGAVQITYDKNWHEYYISKEIQKIDDYFSELNSFQVLNEKNSIDLFGSKAGWGAISGGIYGKVSNKEIKIWEADELIRHYVPCVRVQDAKAGMYDIVNNTFNTCNDLIAYE